MDWVKLGRQAMSGVRKGATRGVEGLVEATGPKTAADFAIVREIEIDQAAKVVRKMRDEAMSVAGQSRVQSAKAETLTKQADRFRYALDDVKAHNPDGVPQVEAEIARLDGEAAIHREAAEALDQQARIMLTEVEGQEAAIRQARIDAKREMLEAQTAEARTAVGNIDPTAIPPSSASAPNVADIVAQASAEGRMASMRAEMGLGDVPPAS